MDQRHCLDLMHGIRSKETTKVEGGDAVLCHVEVRSKRRRVHRCKISNAGNLTWLHGYNSSGSSSKEEKKVLGREDGKACYKEILERREGSIKGGRGDL